MTLKESNCVDCPFVCLYTSCPYYEVEVTRCDMCGDIAEYRIDDTDYCNSCAEELLREIFSEMTVTEKAKAAGMDISVLDTAPCHL